MKLPVICPAVFLYYFLIDADDKREAKPGQGMKSLGRVWDGSPNVTHASAGNTDDSFIGSGSGHGPPFQKGKLCGEAAACAKK